MSELISSLPINSTNSNYSFCVIDTVTKFNAFSPFTHKEGNVCTKSQVAAAKVKGWTPKYYNGSNWVEYEGSDDVQPQSITLPSTETVMVGETITLTPTITPTDAVTTLTWTSDDETIATVSEGVVTGVKKGQTFINVETDNGKTAVCKLTVTESEIKVTGITLDKTTLTLEVGKTQALNATVKPDDATNKSVTWTSSKTSVATVDNNGKVTAVASGNAKITCTANDDSGVSAICTVTVKAVPESITLQTTATVIVGQTITLTPTITPADAVTTFTWTSDDETIAIVSEGVVTGVKKGQTFINVETDNGKTAVCKLTVTEPEKKVTGITLDKTTLTLEVGKSLALNATIKPDDATNKSVTWSSTKTSVATVDNNGKVTAVAAGNATITCTANDDSGVTATCTVTVKAVPESITLQTTATVRTGQMITLTPTITPADAMTTLTWSSDDESIATVSSEGVVTGVKKGQTFINVETDNGKTAYCKLTVTAGEPTAISLPKNVTMMVNQKITLTPTLTPADAETVLTWKSDDESVVRVSADGVLTGVAKGLALVTVSTSNGLTSGACKVKVEPDTTGINDVEAEGRTNTPVYTLSGQRIAAPRKGINIVGGKKVIIK